jgi:glycosyltransferase involved in cell wall biosynthesis
MEIKSNVTVIIPCYNDGKFIIEAVNSILNQTLKADKIIIVDDGSNAETKKVLKNIKHSSVEIVYQENKGVSNARNTAIALAQTDYILNLDADDYFEPSFIEKAVTVLNNNNQVVAVSSYCRTFKNDKTIEIIKPLGGKLKDFIVINNGRANSMFLKKSWEAVGGFDEKMHEGYEDWEFWIAILEQEGTMHIIKEVLSHYRIKNTSRDQKALENHDFELRKYIYLKHKVIYETYLDFYIFQLLKQNSLLRNSINKAKNSIEFNLGKFILKPFRFLKNKVVK